jgi:hypothetical protein
VLHSEPTEATSCWLTPEGLDGFQPGRLLTAYGQLSWPSAGCFVTAYGQDLMTADIRHRITFAP